MQVEILYYLRHVGKFRAMLFEQPFEAFLFNDPQWVRLCHSWFLYETLLDGAWICKLFSNVPVCWLPRYLRIPRTFLEHWTPCTGRNYQRFIYVPRGLPLAALSILLLHGIRISYTCKHNLCHLHSLIASLLFPPAGFLLGIQAS